MKDPPIHTKYFRSEREAPKTQAGLLSLSDEFFVHGDTQKHVNSFKSCSRHSH